MSSCEKCQDLKLQIKIKSPLELEKAIRVIKSNLEDHTIQQKSKKDTDFVGINETGPWDDFIEYSFKYSFKCNHCGCFFELHVETYHGSGGYWKPILG